MAAASITRAPKPLKTENTSLMVFDYESRKENDVNVFTLTGELIDKNQATGLMEEIDSLIEEGEKKFVFDLSGLRYINSSGLNVLIHTLTKARKAGGEALVANVSKKVNELLIITKLNTVFTVADTVDSALDKLK